MPSPKSNSVKCTERKVKAIPIDHCSNTTLYGRMCDAKEFGFKANGIRESIKRSKPYKGYYWRFSD
jgi:hypothetical protein